MRPILFLCFLSGYYLLSLPIFGQDISLKKLQDQADSLSNCGYHKQEIEFRKSILAALPKQSVEHNVASVYLQIAEVNQLGLEERHDEAEKEYRHILASYSRMPVKEQRILSLEVNRMKAMYLSQNNKREEAIILLKYLLRKVKSNSAKAAELNLNIAQIYASQKNYYQAIGYFKKAIEGFEQNGKGNNYETALAYNDLGLAYDYANVEKDMIPSFEKALQIWSTYYKEDAAINSVAYNDFLFVLIDYGDRQKAFEYQRKFEAYMSDYANPLNAKKYINTSPFDAFNALCMYHLSSIRYYDFEFNEAKILEHLSAQERLFASAPKLWKAKEINVLLSSYDSASYAFYMNEQSEKALAYNKILENLTDEDFYQMKVSANRAMLYYYKFDYAHSLVHNQKALDFLQLLGYKTSYLTLLALKAENLANLGKVEESKHTLKELYELEFDKKISLEKVKKTDFEDRINSSYINILIHSGIAYRILYEQNGKNKKDLEVMKNFYRVAAQMFQAYYQKGLFNPSLERQLNNIKEGLLYTAIQTPNDKVFIAECINALENASSQHLWKQFTAKYSDNLNIPKSVLNHLNETKIELSYLTQKEEKTEDELKRVSLLENKVKSVENDIAKKYPSFQRFQSAEFDIQNLQNQLEENQVVLNYAVTDSSVFIYKIDKSTIAITYLGERKEIEEIVKAYYDQIKNINFSFEKNAKILFQKLIKPLAIKEKENLVIVSENILSYLPFEALLDDKSKPLTLKNNISYANSLKFLILEKNSKSFSFDHLLTGFAPQYTNGVGITRSENGALIYTGKELESIASTLGNSAIFLNENATKVNFLNTLGNSRIHHLAMHSMVNEKDYLYSSLLFQNNEKLHFYELYSLNFPSEMVVLSACNTGVGIYANGEGLMSISRALNYAGVKSTVHSLWQVPDKETAELMSYFYNYLDDGLEKNEALALAKKKFIESNPMKIHPFYWAGFVVNGDISPVSTDNYWKWLLVFLAISALVVFAYTKLEKNNLA